MIVAFTGHRSAALGGYKLPNPIYNFVCQEIERVLRELKPEKVISGMAQGVDMWAAMIAYKLGFPFTAAIPFEGQEKAWPIESQKSYRLLRKLATEEIIVSPGGYSPEKMQIRNQFMVDHCDTLIAIFNGSKGGTYNCIQYAKSINKNIIYINPTP